MIFQQHFSVTYFGNQKSNIVLFDFFLSEQFPGEGNFGPPPRGSKICCELGNTFLWNNNFWFEHFLGEGNFPGGLQIVKGIYFIFFWPYLNNTIRNWRGKYLEGKYLEDLKISIFVNKFFWKLLYRTQVGKEIVKIQTQPSAQLNWVWG